MFTKLFLRTCIKKGKQHLRGCLHTKRFYGTNEDNVIKISASYLKQYFKQRSLNVIDGYTCIIAECPVCISRKEQSKLYINKTTGFFMCDTCEFIGPWNILEKILSKPKPDDEYKELNMLQTNYHSKDTCEQTWRNLIGNCQSITDLSEEEYKVLLDNFSLPHVSQEDMSQLNCFYEEENKALHFPLVGLNNAIVGYKSLTTTAERDCTVPVSGAAGCIKYKQPHSKNENCAVVVGMIDDLLTLILKKVGSVIICLPYNLKSLPQQLLPSMETFKKLTLWFGNDDISWYSAKEFAKKLNEKRCYFVRPIASQPQPKLAAEANCNFKTILQNAEPLWHKSIITFHDLREEVLSDLYNNDKVQGVKWKRYPTLNSILKGHRRGEFTILTGPTGSGKTTFVSEYSLDLAMQGINTLWGSFEIRNARLARTMLQQMVGIPLDEDLENFDKHANAFEKLPLYFMTFHGQQSIKVVMDAVEHATYVHDIAHVVIDNVQFMMGTGESARHGDRFWRQDNIIAVFRNFATQHNCHVTMIIHPRKERIDEDLTTASIFGSAKASQEADNVLIIQDKRLSSIRGKKYLQIAKNRYSGDLGIMLLEFDKSSLSYALKSKGKAKSNEKEKPFTKKKLANVESTR